MAEWPGDLLAGVDGARPLSPAARARLSDALLAPVGGESAPPVPARPLGDELSTRLEEALGDPVAAALIGVDGPRPLHPEARRRLARALDAPRRRLVVLSAAAVVVLAGAVGVALAIPGATHAPSTTTASPKRTARGTGGGILSAPGTSGSDSAGSSAAVAAPGPSAGATAGLGGALSSQAAAGPAVGAVTPEVGPVAGGTWVTITGTGLTGVTVVHFGQVPATGVIVVSGTELRARTPAHLAGTVDVLVTSPAGMSAATTSDRFTYTG
ncbi:MAG: IPT/TIG domain-containing protein [Acidimicrobiales bacterium]